MHPRPTGFSTGALALSDFARGLDLVREWKLPVVELSALRAAELPPLIEALDALPLVGIPHVSLHVPSRFAPEDEDAILALLESQRHRGWLYITHPDVLYTPERWRAFGPSLCLENMDQRKPIGRTTPEMADVFRRFPDATWCFDIGHARQVDSSMLEAWRLLKAFGPRLRQVHVSEVNSRSKHDRLSRLSIAAFREVAGLIPDEIPLVIESVITAEEIPAELRRVRAALPAKGETPGPYRAAGEWSPAAVAGD
jgi:hypothetical protein